MFKTIVYVLLSSWNFVLEKTVNTFKLQYFSKYVNHWESGVKRGQPHALQLKRDWGIFTNAQICLNQRCDLAFNQRCHWVKVFYLKFKWCGFC